MGKSNLEKGFWICLLPKKYYLLSTNSLDSNIGDLKLFTAYAFYLFEFKVWYNANQLIFFYLIQVKFQLNSDQHQEHQNLSQSCNDLQDQNSFHYLISSDLCEWVSLGLQLALYKNEKKSILQTDHTWTRRLIPSFYYFNSSSGCFLLLIVCHTIK